MTRVLALLVGLAISWMVLPAAASAAVTRDDSVHAYPYGASIYGAPESATALERGPPVTGYANTTSHAVDLGSHGTSARPSGPAPRATYDYDDTALLAQRDIGVPTTNWRARADTGDISALERWRVAADSAAPLIKAGSEGGETTGRVFPRSVANDVLEDNPSTCVYCRMETDRPQVDHVIPRAPGGNATLENGQTTCSWCNASKGARDFPVNPPPGYRGMWPPEWWGLP